MRPRIAIWPRTNLGPCVSPKRPTSPSPAYPTHLAVATVRSQRWLQPIEYHVRWTSNRPEVQAQAPCLYRLSTTDELSVNAPQDHGRLPVHCQLLLISGLYWPILGQTLDDLHCTVELRVYQLSRIHLCASWHRQMGVKDGAKAGSEKVQIS